MKIHQFLYVFLFAYQVFLLVLRQKVVCFLRKTTILSYSLTKIPPFIEIDISDVHAGSTYYAENLTLESGVSLVSKKRTVIFAISKARAKEAASN